jgi:transcriptional regulator with XRE-family HTH domain
VAVRFSPLRIRAARARAGLPRDRVAVEAGVSYATLTAWERGTAVPDSNKLARVCAVLGVGLDDVFEAVEDVVA